MPPNPAPSPSKAGVAEIDCDSDSEYDVEDDRRVEYRQLCDAEGDNPVHFVTNGKDPNNAMVKRKNKHWNYDGDSNFISTTIHP